MTVNKILMKALEPIASVQASTYESYDAEGRTDEVYITFNYSTNPDNFGDNEPDHEVYSVQVHLFCPASTDSLLIRRDIKNALRDAGFTFPSSVDATDADGQHHIFECLIATEVE